MLTLTFYYGVEEDHDDFPIVAYHPSIRHGFTFDQEKEWLWRTVRVEKSMRGYQLPPEVNDTNAITDLKLWGSWTNGRATFSIRPVKPAIYSICGYVNSDLAMFKRFMLSCKRHNGLRITLLDDDAIPQPKRINLLCERFHFEAHP